MNRRELCAGLAALTASGVTGVKMSQAETENPLAQARVFRFADAPASTATGSPALDRRVLVRGELATGEWVRVHESIAPAGLPAPALHVIEHSEIITVVQGTVEIEHDGKRETAGPGDVIYVAHGTNHRIRNAGDGAARYVIVSIGGDIKK